MLLSDIRLALRPTSSRNPQREEGHQILRFETDASTAKFGSRSVVTSVGPDKVACPNASALKIEVLNLGEKLSM